MKLESTGGSSSGWLTGTAMEMFDEDCFSMTAVDETVWQ
jgi:hypothetical protein